MENLREIVLEQIELGGACGAGIATIETLAGGPESADTPMYCPPTRCI
jgi:hypothetical protein